MLCDRMNACDAVGEHDLSSTLELSPIEAGGTRLIRQASLESEAVTQCSIELLRNITPFASANPQAIEMSRKLRELVETMVVDAMERRDALLEVIIQTHELNRLVSCCQYQPSYLVKQERQRMKEAVDICGQRFAALKAATEMYRAKKPVVPIQKELQADAMDVGVVWAQMIMQLNVEEILRKAGEQDVIRINDQMEKIDDLLAQKAKEGVNGKQREKDHWVEKAQRSKELAATYRQQAEKAKFEFMHQPPEVAFGFDIVHGRLHKCCAVEICRNTAKRQRMKELEKQAAEYEFKNLRVKERCWQAQKEYEYARLRVEEIERSLVKEKELLKTIIDDHLEAREHQRNCVEEEKAKLATAAYNYGSHAALLNILCAIHRCQLVVLQGDLIHGRLVVPFSGALNRFGDWLEAFSEFAKEPCQDTAEELQFTIDSLKGTIASNSSSN